MNDVIIKLGLESNMLNYVDNETPRYYFLSGNADENDLQKFAELIIKECAAVSRKNSHRDDDMGSIIAQNIEKHFGIKE